MATYYWYSGYDGDEEWMVGTIHSASSQVNAVKAAKADLGKEWKDFAVISRYGDPAKITMKSNCLGMVVRRSMRGAKMNRNYYLLYTADGTPYYLTADCKKVSITPALAQKLHIDYNRMKGWTWFTR